MRTLGTLFAFIKRDFLIEVSYRTSFLLQLSGIIFSVLIWRFIGGVIDPAADTPGLEGVDYFAYVVLGLAFFHYLSASITAFSTRVRNEQMTGTLEAMLVTSTSAGTIILGSSLWIFLKTSITVFGYLLVGFLFGIGFRAEGLFPGLIVLIMTILAFSGVGNGRCTDREVGFFRQAMRAGGQLDLSVDAAHRRGHRQASIRYPSGLLRRGPGVAALTEERFRRTARGR